jgi:hypothetical protein
MGGAFCRWIIEDLSEVSTHLQQFPDCRCEIPTEEVIEDLEVYTGWDDDGKMMLSRPLTEEEWVELSIMEW